MPPFSSIPRPTSPSLEVHGHRGCRGLRPENTLSAFLYALALGVDVIEMDVVISADNRVVVSHEPWLNPHICLDPHGHRLEPRTPPAFNLYRMPYAQIATCDCGLLRHPDFPQQLSLPARKPLLSEALFELEKATQHRGSNAISYSIEVKSRVEWDDVFHPRPEIFLPLVLGELEAAGVAARTTLLCFDARVLRLAHQIRPSLATCLLTENSLPWAASIQSLGFVPTTLGPDFTTVSVETVRMMRRDFPGLRLVPWTVNEPEAMLWLASLGVDGITTDYPNILLEMLLE